MYNKSDLYVQPIKFYKLIIILRAFYQIINYQSIEIIFILSRVYTLFPFHRK